jgi:CubicO group peptidase (beta-lactamase class C family)
MTTLYKQRILLTFLSLLLFVSAVAAQKTDQVDDFISSEMKKRNIPGVALAVVRDGKVVKVKGYGVGNVETSAPVTTETVFKIGSISKPIIAMGVMLLVEDGKIALDDKISKYLEGTPETWKDITVRHLLSHTSGIIREAPGFNPMRIQPDADVIKTAYQAPLVFAPGEKYQYCNVGYFALAEIIRKVSGKPWSEFLSERILKPLGMNSTRTTTFDEIIPNRANGYSFTNNKLTNSEVYLALRPSGAFLSTITDMIKLEEALNGKTFLKPETRRTMWTPYKFNDGKDSNYGLGWTIDQFNGRKRIGHGGSLNGFRSNLARFVDDGLTIIVLTNLGEADPAELSRGVAGFYMPKL